MEIHLAPKIEAELRQLTLSQGNDFPQLVEETVIRAWELLQDQDIWFAPHQSEIPEEIRIELAEWDRGESIADYELNAALARLKSQPA